MGFDFASVSAFDAVFDPAPVPALTDSRMIDKM